MNGDSWALHGGPLDGKEVDLDKLAIGHACQQRVVFPGRRTAKLDAAYPAFYTAEIYEKRADGSSNLDYIGRERRSDVDDPID